MKINKEFWLIVLEAIGFLALGLGADLLMK